MLPKSNKYRKSPKTVVIYILLEVFIIGLLKNVSPTTAANLPRSSVTGGRSIDANQKSSPNFGGYEIRTVSGEPNYKSVNLTWEVELVADENETKSFPEVFQIFYCEIQTFGAHRCRSKIFDEVEPPKLNDHNAQYSTLIDNLRMATKYSFHIRPQPKKKIQKASARSESIDNEVDNDNFFNEQTIIIPTKGFSAEATKCLPNASEIEVETGPYFGGKIVVDGGSCGIKGNPKSPKDKYVMRIDHAKCGSLVKRETNTVETFITVQENLGIFTHSTRRFVVVCSFQSGMQTVRASFTVPGKGGVAAPVFNDPFQPDRNGRERNFKFVDRSSLVLKETQLDDEKSSMATVEDIVPGLNEMNIKHDEQEPLHDEPKPSTTLTEAKFAKLIATNQINEEVNKLFFPTDQTKSAGFFSSSFAGLVITISLSVIMIGVFVYVLMREIRRQKTIGSHKQLPRRELNNKS